MASSGCALAICSWKAMVGTAAKGTIFAAATWMLSSGMGASGQHDRAGAEISEEAIDLVPDFGAAGEPFPVGAEETDEAVTLIDGSDIVSGGIARAADAIDEQGLDIGVHLIQARIVLD